MLIRSCLAAIDFNENVDRPVKVSADGKQFFREKVSKRIFFPGNKTTLSLYLFRLTGLERRGQSYLSKSARRFSGKAPFMINV